MGRKRDIQYNDMLASMYPELHQIRKDGKRVLTQTFTFQVTDACNLACTYCYQTHKGTRSMKLEDAKKAVDMLLTGSNGMDQYVTPEVSPGIIIEFIGGEPFMEIELIEKICDYFTERCMELDHPWLYLHRFSICSNGVLYFDPQVQHFLNRYRHDLSFSVTIDGNKELHDSCRIFPDGEPSYDLAVAAAKDWIAHGYTMGSKITIAPGNISYVTQAIKHMVSLGYTDINANCVYEEGWEPMHATVLYQQMKELADYFLEEGFHFENGEFRCSLYEERFFHPKEESDLQNWCGGNGVMLSMDPDGVFFPCIRYMESSLAGDQEPYSIGDLEHGLCQRECDRCRVETLKKIDRRTQSTDKCFYCPIAEGCSWCTAYNYQVFGTPDARATYICVMHQARALANLYFWNQYYRRNGISKRMKNYVPDEWALAIISKKELQQLKDLCRED